jgi:galactokinase/mevalonate kinase-like predicted kinase
MLAPSETLEIASAGEHCVLRSKEDLVLKGDRLDILRAAFIFFGIDPEQQHFSVNLCTEIPMQAGMAGSTALVVTIVGALDRYFRWHMHPWAIAETARKIEAQVLGVLCGLQDQHMAVFGGLNYMDFAGKAGLEQRDDEPLVTVEPLAAHAPTPPLLTANTGIRHHSGVVHKSPRQRWLEGEKQVIERFERIAMLARLGKRALLAGDWVTLGALMNENHALVAAMGGSGPANDRLIEAARSAGAYGAKLAGAGGGGTILVLAEDRERVSQALVEAGAVSLTTPEPMPGLTVTEEIP